MCRRFAISIVICCCINLSGCATKLFQPPPSEFTLWSRAGTSVDELKKAMLECGFPNPHTSSGMTEDAYAKSELCMIHRGYVNVSQDGIMCAQKEYQRRLPTCIRERQSNP